MLHNTWHHLKRQRLALLGGSIVSALILVALLAPLLAPSDPLEQNLYQRLQPSSLIHPLGTDDFGRDILSRIIYGARISLRIGLISISIALSVGTLLGLWAGYRGGLSDTFDHASRRCHAGLSQHSAGYCCGSDYRARHRHVMIAVSIVMVPQYARLVRASVLSIREMAYIEAARALGAGDGRILWRSVLPNCLAPLVVQSTLSLATAILDAAGLSFLGLGAQPPTPEWGAMLSGGRELMLKAPWVMTGPGLAIFTAVLGLNLLGDGLGDALDPKRAIA